MEVVWLEKAVADLEQIDAWLSRIENANPATVRKRIRRAIDSLTRLGDIGRPSRTEGFRELSVRNAPYVIAYRVREGRIEVSAIFHMAQER